MITFRPEALQNVTGSTGAVTASPLLATPSSPVEAPQPASPANASAPAIPPMIIWIFIFPLSFANFTLDSRTWRRANQAEHSADTHGTRPVDAPPQTFRDGATGSPRSRDRQCHSTRDIESGGVGVRSHRQFRHCQCNQRRTTYRPVFYEGRSDPEHTARRFEAARPTLSSREPRACKPHAQIWGQNNR